MRDALLVGSGTALGAVARFFLSTALGAGLWPLLLINIVGSACMGYFQPGKLWGTGFLGGFTSFAAFSVALTHQGSLFSLVPLAYLILTTAGCVGAWLIGGALHNRAQELGAC